MDKSNTNHGTASSGNMRIPYGKDSSEYSGSAAKERIGNIGGSTENIGHTVSGASSVPRQR